MSRMAVIFDPGVEGLAAMAAAVAAGARDKGAQVELLDAGRMDAAALSAYDAAAFGFSPACEAALLPVYVRALETLCGRRVAVFGIRPDDGGVFADTLEKREFLIDFLDGFGGSFFLFRFLISHESFRPFESLIWFQRAWCACGRRGNTYSVPAFR